MRVLINQLELKAGVATVAGLVPSRPVMPALGTIYLQTVDDGLMFRTTDLEAAITHTASAQVNEAGSIAVPAKLLVDLVNNFPAGIVDIHVNGFTVFVKCGQFDCQINGIDPSEYPSIPVVDAESITVEAKPLREALMRSLSAVATDDSRPVLTAIRMAISPTEMVMVSADGFRLSKVQFPLTASTNEQHWEHVLVPAKTLGQLVKSIPTSDTVTITKSASMIQFVLPKTTYTSRLIEGTYPDIERVFPKDFANRMVVDTAELRQALKVARLMNNTVKIAIMEDHINLSANDSGRGNNRTTVSVSRSGDMHTLALNVDYFDDAVTACMSSQVIIETKSDTAPTLIRPVGDDNYWHIVMPMMVR